MIKTEFLVPTRDNRGRPFPRSLWRRLEQQLIRFGGFSRESGIVGAWEFEGRQHRDRSRRYVVALASWTQLPAWLSLIQWVRQEFGQEAIYIEVAGVPEVLGSGDR